MRNSKKEVLELIGSEEQKDLHIHSYYSDGDMEPTKIVDKWMEEGNKIIAITDHDVVEGSIIACQYAKGLDINILPGIEFDSENELGSKLHILGYGIDLESRKLQETLDIIQSWRSARNDALHKEIVDRGYKISNEDIFDVNGGRFVGKPTFARALVNKGYFDTLDEAFANVIQKIDDDKVIKKRTLNPKEVIDTIHDAGGIAVLAHPVEQKKKDESWTDFKPRLVKILDTFLEYGIDGIECYHPSASDEQSDFLVSYAKEHNLVISKGSDFHSASSNRDYSRYHE